MQNPASALIVSSPAQVITGSVLSSTVTVAVQVSENSPSLTVKVTCVTPKTYGPTGLTLKVNGSPFGSDDPLSKSDAEAIPWQFSLASIVIFLQTASGPVFFC